MIPVHGLITLTEAKEALAKPEDVKKLDPRIERSIGEASDRLEALCRRRFIFRSEAIAEGAAFDWAADVLAAVPTPPADARFAIGISWGTSNDAEGTLVVEGTLDGEAVTQEIEVSTAFAAFAGLEVFDTITSATVEDAAGTGNFTFQLLQLYEEFHDTERSSLVYSVNRPFGVLDQVAEGGIAVSYLVLERDKTYVFEEKSGRVQKVGFSGAGTSGVTIGPDFPDDEYFRFPRGRDGRGPAFVSGDRSVRLRYTGGYLGDAERSHVPDDLKRICKKIVAKEFRADLYQDTELTSQSDPAGTRSKKSESDWLAEIEAAIAPHRSSSATAVVQIA